MVSRGECVRNAGRGLRGGLLLTTALGAACLATQALAAGQTSPPGAKTAEQPGATSQVEEVVVTANRSGAESIQNVPLAISVVNTDSLEKSGSTNFSSIAKFTPGLVFQEGAPGINKIDIRGLATGGIVTSDVSERSLVAVYLDDTPISLQGQTPDLRVYDLERVEVLRGPQGTLYGAGSMAGTIRFITAKPDAHKFFGDIEAIGSGTEHGGGNYSLRGVLNAPIIQDKLAIRASIYQGEDSGFIDNVGAVNKKDTNLNRSTQFRIAARWFATDKLTVDASVTYEKSHAYGLNGGFSGLGEYKNSTNSPEGTRDNFLLYNVGVNYDLGWANLISSTSYTQRHIGLRASPERQIAYFFQDYGTGLPVGQGAYPLFTQPATYNQAITNSIPAEYYIINNKIHDVMEEVRLSSKPGHGPFKWTTGVFFEEQRRNYYQDIPTPGFDKLSYQNLFYGPFNNPDGSTAYNSQLTDQAFSPDDIFSGIQNQEEYQVALFGEGTYTLFNKLDLTVGLRYFNFRENFNLFFSGVYGVDPGPGPTAHQPLVTKNTLTADGVNPRFNASYHVNDDILVYAEAAKGFRYGGVNQPVPVQFCGADLATAHLTSAPQTYGPDSLWSYSVGEKAKLANGRITLNTDAFYIDWSDVQTRLLLGQCSYYFIQNKGAIISRGLEAQTTFRVTDELTLTANTSYTDSYANGPIVNLNAVDGDRAPYFPKWIVGVGGSWDHHLGDGVLRLQGNYQYRSDQYTTFDANTYVYDANNNPTATNVGKNTGYIRIPRAVDLTASATYEIGQYEIGLFGNNLTNGTKEVGRANKPAYIGTFQNGNDVTYARPRTVGVRVKVKF